ncbi:MAG: alpha-ketoglutarate-dependent dioxygenase AlkB [Gammaproteobacteria bacterium]|nr:alpha-ketoglutarate-dependent dioxygenase AlkB [Gammaproteobacteria bacterium]
MQHYGWRYDYRSRIVSSDMLIGEFPVWLQSLGAKLCEAEFFDQMPSQAIVNEYLPGQGIAMHIDRQCFGPVVATISLGDAWHMNLQPLREPRSKTKQILLEVGSVLILSGDARYEWMHGISSRQREREEHGGWRPRERRLSVTFRTVLPDQ